MDGVMPWWSFAAVHLRCATTLLLLCLGALLIRLVHLLVRIEESESVGTIIASVVATSLLFLAGALASNFPDDSVSRRGWGQAAVILWLGTTSLGLFVLAYRLQ